ncbi:Protein of uncharacterised function (DUF523) [Clostridium putrefaciens]|uniref:Protein of uncharacterized function (DUF523) n=1 Tax=Clostridium putrefaciens TaxID=99675 RepID=A0A381J8I7_9CLOT|nr:CD3072 family TudS-related putative desulfidase [Clostridium putrefaciens]SUY46717.1 Protein of uncharacterised function (DUF523) [Clostridium putrefaciens]
MERSRKICIVPHCFLNANSKVEGPCRYKAVLKPLVYALIERDYGIIQLPCPELTFYGIRRWGHVRNQFDNPYFRKHCREILEPIILQIKEYEANNYEVKHIIGVNGSPSCGIDVSCGSNSWKGEISKIENLEYLKKDITYDNKPGIYMEEFIQLLKEEGIEINFVGINEKDIDKYDFNKIL